VAVFVAGEFDVIATQSLGLDRIGDGVICRRRCQNDAAAPFTSVASRTETSQYFMPLP
jgi:hypothetical protein